MAGIHIESHFQHPWSLRADVAVGRGVKIVVARSNVSGGLKSTGSRKWDTEELGSSVGGGLAQD